MQSRFGLEISMDDAQFFNLWHQKYIDFSKCIFCCSRNRVKQCATVLEHMLGPNYGHKGIWEGFIYKPRPVRNPWDSDMTSVCVAVNRYESADSHVKTTWTGSSLLLSKALFAQGAVCAQFPIYCVRACTAQWWLSGAAHCRDVLLRCLEV